MLHEIFPLTYHCEYRDVMPAPGDRVLAFDGDTGVYLREGAPEDRFFRFEELSVPQSDCRYLFSIDDDRYFLLTSKVRDGGIPGGEFTDVAAFRGLQPKHLAFAGITAHSMYLWYTANRFCGRCGETMGHHAAEHAIVCPKCGLTVYPKISPVVIVGVTDGDKLLMTRYAHGPYNRYALVAGFAEIGESLEDTVRREVMEETGVRVKNLRYYKSQPWGFSSSLLSGFFAELDGEPDITLDENELAEALWLPRPDIPPTDNTIALTAEMIELFRSNFN